MHHKEKDKKHWSYGLLFTTTKKIVYYYLPGS